MRLEELRNMAVGSSTRATPEPLRIVHVLRSPLGGLFRHVVDLVEAQHKAGLRVGLVCNAAAGPDDPANEALTRLAPCLALGLIRAPMRRDIGLSDLTATVKLSRQVRAMNPDVLHGHGAKGGAYARTIGTLLRATGTRVARIYTPHGGSLHYDRRTFAGRVYLRTERLLARMTDAFIFVSAFERDAFLAKVAKTKKPMTIVHNGLKAEEFTAVTPADDARDFLFIGEMRDMKGPDLMIGAIALMRHRTGTAPTAVFVGSGPDEQKYQTVVAELGLADSIQFRGPLPVREALALARTVVVPSRAESMPYVVLETIAAGVPLIAANVGGIPEIFGEDMAKDLVPPGDPTALADAMAAAMTSPGAAMATATALKIHIRSAFTIEAMAAAVEGVYRTVTVR